MFPKIYYGQAIQLMMRAIPAMAAVVGAHAAFLVLLMLFYLFLFGLFYVFQGMEMIPLVIFFAALGGSYGLYHLAQHYILYLVKAGYVAVIAELLKSGRIPDGQGQIEFGKNAVQARFAEISVLSGLDLLIKGVVGAVTGAVNGLINFIPGSEGIQNALRLLTRKSTEYIDEAIIAKIHMQKSDNPFQVAAESSVLYAMAWKPILGNAVGLALFSWASFVIFLIAFAPLGYLLTWMMPGSFLPTVAVVACAYLAKISIGDLFAMTTTIVAFHEETKSLNVSEEWDARLEKLSDKYVELKQKARDYIKGKKDNPASPILKQEVKLPPPPPVQVV